MCGSVRVGRISWCCGIEVADDVLKIDFEFVRDV